MLKKLQKIVSEDCFALSSFEENDIYDKKLSQETIITLLT